MIHQNRKWRTRSLVCRFKASRALKWLFVIRILMSRLNRCPSDEYTRYRNRARSPGRSCFKRRGIKSYILASGQVDYEDSSSRLKAVTGTGSGETTK